MRVLWLCILLLPSCSQKLPGKAVGTFQVTMHLESNTCGEQAVYLRDGDRYAVEIRADGPKAYWHLADSQPLEGQRTSDEYKFALSTIVASQTGDAGPNRCQLQQDEMLEATLHEGRSTDKARSAEEDAGTRCPTDDETAADG